MNTSNIEDDYFGLLRWNAEFQEWHGSITISPHDEVGVELPAEYAKSLEMRTHIRDTMQLIKRDELNFRQRAASELFAENSYLFFWPENQPFDRDEFADEMHLGIVTFDPEFPDAALTLDYEYGDGVEHGIAIYLTWDGAYRYARVA